MSEFYDEMAASSAELLQEFGGPVTLRREVPGQYDPGTGGIGPGTTADYLGTGVKLNYEAENIDGTLIQRGDQKLLLSPLQHDGTPMPTPTVSDLVLIGGAAYTIANVGELQPVEVSLLFTLQLRGV